MTADIKISLEEGHIRVIYRGKVDYGATDTMLREIGQLAAANKRDRLLFDIRNADTQGAYVDAIRHAEEADSLGVRKTFHIAVLGKPGDPMLQYVENVTINRGYRLKAFTDESEALRWLRKEPSAG